MAIKTFNCNLNGGDALTANEDLIYRIYGSADNYTTPIASAGSHNSDANVTVTADVVEITNVDVLTETSYKIAAVDEAGNEGILSPAISPYILDAYPGASLGIGLYKLKSSAVYACQIRRDTDDAVTDVILEDDGPITLSSLVSAGGDITTWGAGGRCTIKTMYDQSGSGNDIFQTTITAQPELVNAAGNMHQFGGEAAYRSVTGKSLVCSRLLTTNLWTIIGAYYHDDVSAQGTSEVLASQHTGSADVNRVAFIQAQKAALKSCMYFNNGAGNTGSYSTDWQDGAQLTVSIAVNDDYFFKQNAGALEEVISNQAMTPLDTSFRVGAQGTSSANGVVGYVKELIVYPSDETADLTSILANINGRHSIH